LVLLSPCFVDEELFKGFFFPCIALFGLCANKAYAWYLQLLFFIGLSQIYMYEDARLDVFISSRFLSVL
jgi:hypothetical protein